MKRKISAIVTKSLLLALPDNKKKKKNQVKKKKNVSSSLLLHKLTDFKDTLFEIFRYCNLSMLKKIGLSCKLFHFVITRLHARLTLNERVLRYITVDSNVRNKHIETWESRLIKIGSVDMSTATTTTTTTTVKTKSTYTENAPLNTKAIDSMRIVDTVLKMNGKHSKFGIECICAGGFAHSFERKIFENNDIDFFFVEKNNQLKSEKKLKNFIEFLKLTVATLKAKCYEISEVFKTKHSINMIVKWTKTSKEIYVQFIYKILYITAEQLLCCFDLDCCRVCIRGSGTISSTREYIRAVNSKVNILSKDMAYTDTTYRRIFKYYNNYRYVSMFVNIPSILLDNVDIYEAQAKNREFFKKRTYTFLGFDINLHNTSINATNWFNFDLNSRGLSDNAVNLCYKTYSSTVNRTTTTIEKLKSYFSHYCKGDMRIKYTATDLDVTILSDLRVDFKTNDLRMPFYFLNKTLNTLNLNYRKNTLQAEPYFIEYELSWHAIYNLKIRIDSLHTLFSKKGIIKSATILEKYLDKHLKCSHSLEHFKTSLTILKEALHTKTKAMRLEYVKNEHDQYVYKSLPPIKSGMNK